MRRRRWKDAENDVSPGRLRNGVTVAVAVAVLPQVYRQIHARIDEGILLFSSLSLFHVSLCLYIPEGSPLPRPRQFTESEGMVASELPARSQTQTDSAMEEGRLDADWVDRRSRLREHQVLWWSGVCRRSGDSAICGGDGVRKEERG